MQSPDNKTCHYPFRVSRRRPYRRPYKGPSTRARNDSISRTHRKRSPCKNHQKKRKTRNAHYRDRSPEPLKPTKRHSKHYQKSKKHGNKHKRNDQKQKKKEQKVYGKSGWKYQKREKKNAKNEQKWVKKKEIQEEVPMETRNRGTTFISNNTKDTSDDRIPDVRALTKMLELQKQFEQKSGSEKVENKGSAFDKILDSRYSNSSVKTCSNFSECEGPFEIMTPEKKKKVKLVVDLSEIRKKINFDEEEEEDTREEDVEEEKIEEEENIEDDEFEFLLTEIDEKKRAIQHDQELEFDNSDSEDLIDLNFANNSNDFSENCNFFGNQDGRFMLDFKYLSTQAAELKDKASENELYSLEDTFFTTLVHKEELIETQLIKYQIEQQTEEEYKKELESINDIITFFKENQYFTEYLQKQNLIQLKKVGKMKKFYKYLSKTAFSKRKSFMQSLCPMGTIDSLFSPSISTEGHQSSETSPATSKPNNELPDNISSSNSQQENHKNCPDHKLCPPKSNFSSMSPEKKKKHKKYNRTIVINRCQRFEETGICMKGANCSKLHICEHSKYQDLRRCVVNILRAISKKHKFALVEDLLDCFNKMKPALETFEKIMYRRPEISIFDEIFEDLDKNY